MHAPGSTHFEAVYKILRYMKGTLGKGILSKKHDHLCVKMYIHVDWVSNITTIARSKKKKKHF